MSNADFGANMADVGAVVWRNGTGSAGTQSNKGYLGLQCAIGLPGPDGIRPVMATLFHTLDIGAMPPKAILRISFNCQSFGLTTHSPDECVKGRRREAPPE